MKAHRRGEALSRQVPPQFKMQEDLAEGTRITAIGNSMGYGIHASMGRGLFTMPPHYYKFYAPIFNGNSGGPIFTDDDKVIGLVRAQSKEIYSANAFNVAVPINLIINQLKEKLPKEIFDQLAF